MKEIKNIQIIKLAEKLRKPQFVGVLDDLIAFTGLSEENICRHIINSGLKVRAELKFVNPKGDAELKLFYRCCREYLFLNAYREVWPIFERVKFKGRALDFAGGMGNDSIWVSKERCQVDYHEISIIQRAFMKFRIGRHELKSVWVVDDLNRCADKYNTIFLRDVLEHVPDYNALIKQLSGYLNPGGLIIEHTPWNNKERNSPLHFKEKTPLKKVFKDLHFVNIANGVWRKNG